MALLHVCATGCIWSGRDPGAPDLAERLDALPAGRPVVILIHGYRYAPGSPADDPHDLILSARPLTRCGHLGWPHHLGIESDGGALGIGFGWQAMGPIWAARAEAARAGLALAALVTRIRRLSPGRLVTVLAHSLGARVLLSALPAVDAGDIARAVLLVPAVLSGEARRALATPAGKACEFVNVITAENRVFDFGFELLVSGGFARSAGRGLGSLDTPAAGRWVEVALDDPAQRDQLARLGHPVPSSGRRVCHWSVYQRAPLFALYRALVAETPDRMLPLARLVPPAPASTADPRRALPGMGVGFA